MDYKEANKKAYDRNASYYKEKYDKEHVKTHVAQTVDLFIKNIKGKNILDIGCGHGIYALFFKNKGFNPICIDISPKMIELCKQRGLEAYEMDLESLKFKENSFDGMWARLSLQFMPKSKFIITLKKIKKILKPKGVFYIEMKRGNFEGFEEKPKYTGYKRFFSLYTDKELREILSKHFIILHSSKVFKDKETHLNYLCKNNK